MPNNCTIERVMLIQHSKLDLSNGHQIPGMSETVTGPCDAPLFSRPTQAVGACSSCLSGWEVPDNHPSEAGREQLERINRPDKRSEEVCGRALQTMIEAAHNYCLDFRGATDQSIGDDCVLGPEMRAILGGLRGLLNGPTGPLDCAKADATLLDLARAHDLADDNGEV